MRLPPGRAASFRAAAQAHRGQVVGELRLSAFPTAARGLFPAALVALRAGYPALRVRSCELEPERGVNGVVRGDLDLAVVLDWYNKPMPLPDGLVKAPLPDDAADVALPAGHRLVGRGEVDLAEFAEDEWITWGEGEFCHEWLMFTLRSRGIEPVIGHRAAETHTQLGLVAAGLGVCIAPAARTSSARRGRHRATEAAGAAARVRRMARGRRPPPVDPGGGGGVADDGEGGGGGGADGVSRSPGREGATFRLRLGLRARRRGTVIRPAGSSPR
ncbi:LysR substrate-binding domain-containing protein [Streptomyces sp. WG5]|uniref:LysR substrate-binding domain-containing protein n=1 Tax=Streptomyces sp. WG5 TaxID=3417648 RepID=UPI003CF36FF3